MSSNAVDAGSRSRRVHENLTHPIIDGDGHWLEPYPVFLDYLRDVGGKAMVAEFTKGRFSRSSIDWYETASDVRMAKRMQRPPRWGVPPNALDRATVSMPSLLYERLDEFGIDFAIVYPTMGLMAGSSEPSSDLRRAVCRAHNVMSAEMFADYSDRMTPVAVIPMITPEEAIEEAEYAVKELHFKTALILGTVTRPIAAYSDSATPPTYVDNLVLDSVYDYDALWDKFMELNLAVTTHSGSAGWGDRRSPSSQCFNHIGHFAQANHTFARAIFFSGVTYRYPRLNFAFLEGGVGWACNLLGDIIGHWHVRSREALLRMNPTNLDGDELQRLFREYGGRWLSDPERAREQMNYLEPQYPGFDIKANTKKELDLHGGEVVDDFEAAHISTEGDIRDRFTSNYYFGCEADDPMTALAFDPRFEGLKPVLGSDIGHFDVADMTDVIHEAYELVDDGFMTEDNFKAFTFGNIAHLHGGMNPNFFKGTVVESAVSVHLAASTDS